MRLVLEKSDFVEALGEEAVARDFELKRGVLDDEESLADSADELVQRVTESLPRVLAKKFRNLIPADMTLHELTFMVSVEGKPFGVGIGGEVQVTLRKE